MQSIQTSHTFSLSSVKPLDGLLRYREYCLGATKKAFLNGTTRRSHSPVSKGPLELIGNIGEFEYVRCPESGSFFLAQLPKSDVWTKLLVDVTEYRHSSQTFHADITQSRLENVFEPKLNWIQNTLRFNGVSQPKIIEVGTPPSPFTGLLKNSSTFSEVLFMNEMELIKGTSCKAMDAAVLLESIDHVNDPTALLQGVSRCLKKNGYIFVTAQVSSGFDITVLGVQNAYIYPPDRTNCFSLEGLKRLLTNTGFNLLEISTPGVLDVEVVKAHLKQIPQLQLSAFEKRLLLAESETHTAFQSFLQQCNLSSFARIVAQK